MPEIQRFSHASFSVRDLAASTAWYCDVLGFTILEDLPGETWTENVLVHPCGMILTLFQHNTNGGEGFDPVRTGMDHLALLVPDRAELDAWHVRLKELGVDHSAPVDMPYGSVLSFKDPDRIALELFWRDGHP